MKPTTTECQFLDELRAQAEGAQLFESEPGFGGNADLGAGIAFPDAVDLQMQPVVERNMFDLPALNAPDHNFD